MVDILLVEDNKELSLLVSSFLYKEGYSIYCAFSGEEAIKYLCQDKAKLVLLDVMLPGMDGFAVCNEIRKNMDIPIIFISARIDKESKLNGFNYGADDYIEKPVDIDILKAKLMAVFKRYYDTDAPSSIIKSGKIVVNQDTMEVCFDGKPVNLTIKEYDLLLLFIENKGKTLNKDYIFNTIWGQESFSENQTLTVHIKMLRDKVEEDSKKPKRIITVWGVGYRYEEV